MNKKIKQNALLLIHLKECKQEVCNKVIHVSDSHLIDIFSEIIHNINRLNVLLSPQQLNRLKPFKKEALTLLNKYLSVHK